MLLGENGQWELPSSGTRSPGSATGSGDAVHEDSYSSGSISLRLVPSVRGDSTEKNPWCPHPCGHHVMGYQAAVQIREEASSLDVPKRFTGISLITHFLVE